MVTDSDGNKIVVGGFDGLNVDFGTDETLSSDKNSNIFIVKYDSNNNVVFLKGIGGNFSQEGNYSNDYASDVKVDSENNIYVLATIDVGTLQKVDLDPEHPESNSIISTSYGNDFSEDNHNAFLIKYSPEGKMLWYREVKDDYTDRSFSLFIDTNNDVWATGYVGGFTGANIDFDTSNEYSDNRDIIQGEFLRLGFVARYNSNGDFIDVKGIGGGTFSNLHVCLAPTGNMYLAGSFSANKTGTEQGLSLFKNSEMPVYIESQGFFEFAPQNTDVFVLKCNASGNVEWVKTISSTSSNEVTDIAIDGDEHVYISGYFSGNNVDFDTDTDLSYDTNTSVSNGSGFVAEYDTEGSLTMLKTIDGGTRSRIHSLAVTNNGTIAVGGDFKGDVSFGDISLNASSSNSNPLIAIIDSVGNWNNVKKIEKNGYASIANIGVTANNDIQFVGFEAVIYTEEYNIESIFYGNAESELLNTASPVVLDVLVNSISVQGQGGATSITTKGGTLQMEATVLPANADDTTYTWSVTNGTGEATIDSRGLLTAVSNGIVTVTATANDGSGV
ncbi:Ig-like domain-containing protein, partial [Flexithrix dorotheae]|uniref:Ig-like domain-containing protein n=1 Tax=Flexithrix dorotheae TaxID=70993 RepID=UPI00146E280C